MRLHETDPQRERLAVAPTLFEVLPGATRDERALHILVVPWIGELACIQPDARGIHERPPCGLGRDTGGDRAGRRMSRPFARDHVLGHTGVEPEQPWTGRTIEVHLTEHGGLIPRLV